MGADPRFGLEHAEAGTGSTREQLAGDRLAEDAAADDDEIALGGGAHRGPGSAWISRA
jgi:hypothetical protein